MPEDNGSSSPGELFYGLSRPGIITVSGANKDVGKSSLAAYLAGRCRECAGMKVSLHAERPPGEAVIEERDACSDTDTGRILKAGARPVFWVRTTADDLHDDFRDALSRIPDADMIILEGNSILDYLDPDYAVFIMGPTFEGFKPSAWRALKKAHTVLINGGRKLAGPEAMALEGRIKDINPVAKVIIVSERGKEAAWEMVLSRAAGRLGGEYMSSELDEKLAEAVKEKAVDGRLPCPVALKLAEEMGVPAGNVGKAANALNIKITACSLGCF